MTNIGDKLNVVMGSDGKYYAKSTSSVSVGDNLQVFIGDGGKWYASKSSSPVVGSNMLVSIDSTGKYIAHKSGFDIPIYDTLAYQGFGGGNEILYTVWRYSIGGDYFIFVEKRDINTLVIIDVFSIPIADFPFLYDVNLYPTDFQGIFNNSFGGTEQYFIVGKNDYISGVWYETFYFYDTYNNCNLIFTNTVNTFQNEACSMSGNIFTAMQPGSRTNSRIYYKWNMQTSVYLGYLNLSDEIRDSYAHGGSRLIVRSSGFGQRLELFDFPSGDNRYNDGAYGQFNPTTFIDSNIGYSEVTPISIGSDICTGWIWNTNTNDLTKSAF